jgi:hypothetical protein
MKSKPGSLLLILMLLCQFSVNGQLYKLTGIVLDRKDGTPLPGVTVIATDSRDTNIKNGTVTELDGSFEITAIGNGMYSVQLSYLGYKSLSKAITIADDNKSLGTLRMESDAKELKGITVAGRQIRGEQKGDTSQFNADAYKTNPDATAEDLVSKMPGVSSDNTGVKVNGEKVQQILVDGKPFFGTDPTLTLKNLPAEVIDKIQIFDKLSDQSGFTGFDDGNAQKTMNIITRKNKSEGVFGKVYAGYGNNDLYTAGGNLNYFNGERRISILGMSNNINQQNFSAEDILGVSSGSSRSRGGRGGRGGGNSSDNFMVGQQGGIATTHSGGINYSDAWGKKMKVTASYFVNGSDNVNTSNLTRNYITSADSSVRYNDSGTININNFNHRANARLDYTIDSSNSIIFTPALSFQSNKATNESDAGNSLADVLQSQTVNRTNADNAGYNASGNLLYQHKFNKPRRTISFNLNASANGQDGNGANYSLNEYFDTGTVTFARDQRYDLSNSGTTVSGNLSYTEPVGKRWQVQLSYNPSLSKSSADKETQNLITNSLDTAYSNKYRNDYVVQKGGLNYRIGERGANFNVGVNIQEATLAGDQQFPRTMTLTKSFFSVLPNAFYNHRYKDGRNIRVMYRTSTNVPSVTQLQNLTDISNPLLIRTGNVALKQTYDQRFIVRYGQTNAQSGRNFFLNLYTSGTWNYIGTATYIPTRDSIFTDNITNTSILLNRGSQLSRPVNLNGYWNSRLFLTYGAPIVAIKSNINFNGGLGYVRTPGMINDVVNYSGNLVPSFGLVLSSNISEQIDFALAYSGSYNVVSNSIQSASNNNFYNHTASFRINWIFLDNFVLNTNIANNYYTAFSSTGGQNYYLWSAYLGYKLFKKTLEARITAYDILNQNTSISRNVTETYIENANTQVLTSYFMFQLTYTVRKFKSGAPPEAEKPDEFEGRRHRGM